MAMPVPMSSSIIVEDFNVSPYMISSRQDAKIKFPSMRVMCPETAEHFISMYRHALVEEAAGVWTKVLPADRFGPRGAGFLFYLSEDDKEYGAHVSIPLGKTLIFLKDRGIHNPSYRNIHEFVNDFLFSAEPW